MVQIFEKIHPLIFLSDIPLSLFIPRRLAKSI
jgi:hypothetical protein